MNNNNPKKKGQITTREELIFALSWAAELEHGLTCIYLFAAFTMKRFTEEGIDDVQQDQIRNWQGTILAVAMQEMEHLGYVCNLLNAVGGAQHFNRPNLPQPKEYYSTEGPFTLEKFNAATIKRFMEYEKPAPTTDAEGTVLGTGLVPDIIEIIDHHTVQDLYNSILHGFKYLNKTLGPKKLFIGNQDAQLEDGDIVVGYANNEYGINLEKVTDLKSAIKAIDVIVEQGEGVNLTPPKGTKTTTLAHLYQALVKEIEILKNLDSNKKIFGRALIKTAGIILKTLNHVPRFLKDKAMVALLKKYEAEIEKNIAKAKKSLSSSKKLDNIRDEIVDICVYDVEGILLSQITDPGSHYLRFWQIYQEMKGIKNYDPARNVVMNPALRYHADNAGQKINKITYPYSYRTLEVFNASYESMVQMLILIFSFSGITTAERTLLIHTAFFPFMTMIIRPLSEILTLLPAYEDQKGFDAPRAGPAFEYYLNIAQMPQVDQGWDYLYERLTQISEATNKLNTPGDLEEYLQPELIKKVDLHMTALQKNIARVTENFKIGFDLK